MVIKIPHNEKLTLLSLVLLGLGLFYSVFLLDTRWGLGFPIFNLFFILSLLLLRPEIRQEKLNLFYLSLSFILSIFMALRSFGMGQLINILAVFLLNCLAVRSSGNDLSLKALIFSPFFVFLESFKQLPYWLNVFTKDFEIKGQGKTILRGLSIGIPISLLFFFLFRSADPLFKQLTDRYLFSFNLDFWLIKQILELLLVLSVVSAFLRVKLKSLAEFSLIIKTGTLQKDIGVATILLCLLISVYLVIQGQYLFATPEYLQQLGIMFSEYTRKGYAEVLIISFISLILISILIGKKSIISPTFPRVVSIFFIVEILLLLASASRRVYLYQDQFGFTQIRLMGILFSAWLTITLLIFLSAVFDKIKSKLFLFTFVNALLVILIMNLVNIDYVIGVIKKPNLGYKIDYKYVANLSTDAWKSWEDVFEFLEGTNECYSDDLQTVYALERKLINLRLQEQSSWHNFGSYVVADAEALNYLKENETRLTNIKLKLNDCILKNPI